MVTPSIEIIRAQKEHAQLLSDLSNVTFIETYRGSSADENLLEFIDRCFNEAVITSELENPSDHYFIAFADGYPAGYMRLKEDYEDYPLNERFHAIQLKRIYVLKDFHSKKIGAALMWHALQFASEHNYELIWLGVWEKNEKAISFYKRWGFLMNRNYPFYVGDEVHTDHWMVKKLSEP